MMVFSFHAVICTLPKQAHNSEHRSYIEVYIQLTKTEYEKQNCQKEESNDKFYKKRLMLSRRFDNYNKNNTDQNQTVSTAVECFFGNKKVPVRSSISIEVG
jgi:hypothetical protein